MSWKETSRPYFPHRCTFEMGFPQKSQNRHCHDSQKCGPAEDSVMPSNTVGRTKGPEPV